MIDLTIIQKIKDAIDNLSPEDRKLLQQRAISELDQRGMLPRVHYKGLRIGPMLNHPYELPADISLKLSQAMGGIDAPLKLEVEYAIDLDEDEEETLDVIDDAEFFLAVNVDFLLDDCLAARTHLLVAKPLAVLALDEGWEPEKGIGEWFSRLFDAGADFKREVAESWGYGEDPDYACINGVASIEALYIAPLFKGDAFLEQVIRACRDIAFSLSDADTDIPMTVQLMDVGVENEHHEFLDPDSVWWVSSLKRMGAIAAPPVDHGNDFTGCYESKPCHGHAPMVLLPRHLAAV